MSDTVDDYTIFEMHPTQDPTQTLTFTVTNIALDGFAELFPWLDVRDTLQTIADNTYADELAAKEDEEIDS
ncbi:hypothetical protein PHIM7_230 [Sinorhizobium phage phiM7]|uniref:Uncharacterized protein n=3 Tax=Emdodecavirus TaxID=1980937 RepID=S5MQ32_9CAUD|nr:hypothetical protein AB690_gp276 [Sinorhizobium phage phiM12]YP_009212481.1 hypothetical protein AVT40_gp292 [Sinorhizobium phage phiN3]YP_009601355.1 hypothetical protein FDH46_gp248 [Sinorhizobium phage phiM7]AKF13136.1 hypothetical protein PHIM19_231 [Sinorhizobium phage phiM19]AGR47940.1 hypothetical protein SmphiM12_308 [Sinorhizobium phage phiM12]AKF12775.1 hypothetical protein PHIM7_230 [Sinorhizobium phage phiM7]AKF13504.1 hypothetical protein PHIN3_241 [Sinorhizobium phage phiN3]